MIYLDNAATTWPKPECVLKAMERYLGEVGANPGRSGHRLANEAERIRFGAREAVAELFGASDPTRVVFTLNATMALNLAIQGILIPGSHALTTGMEHNAVLRPLRAMEERGVSISLVPGNSDGTLEVSALRELIRPETRLIVLNHGSNVCGTVLPIREVGEIARERGIPFLVDAAQTGGSYPIQVEADHVDFLAFSGHKGLLGPTGTGGLVIHPRFDASRLAPLVYGGTGSRSEQERHPDFLPDRYEAGTPNILGLAGLEAAVRYLLDRGVEKIRAREENLCRRLIDGLRRIPGVQVYGTLKGSQRIATLSFNISKWTSSEVAFALDERFDILCRPGLHCAPRAHRTLGTYPDGTVRLAPGPFNTEAEVDRAIGAVASLAGEKRDG